MAFILIPKNGIDVMVNAWNWRPTLALLRDANLIDDDLYERMGTFGREAKVDADAADRIADFLDNRLPVMKEGDRIRADLTVTDEAKQPLTITPETQIEQIDMVYAHSATYKWLVQFRDFTRSSGGFEVV
jgi:hypothetical protein